MYKRQLGYAKNIDVKIVRTKHMVGFKVGTSIDTLMHMLTNIPSGAEIDEVISEDEEDDLITIEFHEEKRVD